MTKTPGATATSERDLDAGPFDKVAYLFALEGLYVMVGGLMFYGFWEKAVEGVEAAVFLPRP